MKHIPTKITSLSILIAVLLLAAVVLLACGPASQSDPGLASSGPVTAKDDVATPTPKPAENLKYPNLSPLLLELALLDEAGELTEEQIAAKAPMYHGPQVFVDIDIVNDLAEHKDLLGASVNRSIVSKWLENEGALPKSVGPEYRPPYIYAWVKVSDLGALSQQPAVISVTELHDLDGSFAKMVADGNVVLYLPIWVKNDPYERLDYDLAELLYSYKMGEITAQQLAKEYQGHTDGKVLLEIELMSDPVNTAAIVQWLKDEAVTIRAVSKTEQYINIINARVPVELLEMLAAQPGLYGIRSGYGIPPDTNDVLPRNQNGPPESAHSARNSSSTPVPTPTPVISQGVAAHGADHWQPTYTGNGVKVGIIDLGFTGLSDLMGNELPEASMVSARCYGSGDVMTFTLDITDCGGKDHGTLVAQAVVDMAEDVELYISNASITAHSENSRLRLKNDVDWMIQEGVDIINYSVSWHFREGLGDGIPRFDNSLLDTIDTATQAGILWVNSAGNRQSAIWHGRFSDTSVPADRYHDFRLNDDRNYIGNVQLYKYLRAELRWHEDWPGADCDLDLELWWEHPTSGQTVQVRTGHDTQFGDADDKPYEFVYYPVQSAGTYYLRVLKNRHATAARCSDVDWIQLHATEQHTLEHSRTGHSVAFPSTSRNPGLMALGAASYAPLRSSSPSVARVPPQTDVTSLKSSGPTVAK